MFLNKINIVETKKQFGNAKYAGYIRFFTQKNVGTRTQGIVWNTSSLYRWIIFFVIFIMIF